jgi:hypothetical protein
LSITDPLSIPTEHHLNNVIAALAHNAIGRKTTLANPTTDTKNDHSGDENDSENVAEILAISSENRREINATHAAEIGCGSDVEENGVERNDVEGGAENVGGNGTEVGTENDGNDAQDGAENDGNDAEDGAENCGGNDAQVGAENDGNDAEDGAGGNEAEIGAESGRNAALGGVEHGSGNDGRVEPAPAPSGGKDAERELRKKITKNGTYRDGANHKNAKKRKKTKRATPKKSGAKFGPLDGSKKFPIYIDLNGDVCADFLHLFNPGLTLTLVGY